HAARYPGAAAGRRGVRQPPRRRAGVSQPVRHSVAQLTFMPSALSTGVHLSISDFTHFCSDSGVWRSSDTISAPRSAILPVNAGDFSAVFSALLKRLTAAGGVPAGA